MASELQLPGSIGTIRRIGILARRLPTSCPRPRLLRGERVTTPVVLSEGAVGLLGGGGGENGLSSLATGLASLGVGMGPGGGGRGREVLLELLLVDAHLTLPRDAFGKTHGRAWA